MCRKEKRDMVFHIAETIAKRANGITYSEKRIKVVGLGVVFALVFKQNWCRYNEKPEHDISYSS